MPPTPLDVRFRLFRFPVRVSLFFWLAMALLGQHTFAAGAAVGLIWVACGFLSILVHELGHGFAFRRYGTPASIELMAFGGVAIPSYPLASATRRLLVAAAGPAAGFLLVGLVYGSNALADWESTAREAKFAYSFLILVGLAWNLFNLLPVWPLDGGRILRELLVLAGRRRPDRTAFLVSMLLAGALGVYGLLLTLRLAGVQEFVPWWLTPGPMGTLFMLVLAVQSYWLYRQQSAGPRLYVDDDGPWHRRAQR